MVHGHAHPLNFDAGKFGILRRSTSFVRINNNGVQFIDSNSTTSFFDTRQIDLKSGCYFSEEDTNNWHQVDCRPSQLALCEQLDDSKMLWFPRGVVDVPDNEQSLIGFVDNCYLQHNLVCQSHDTGRVVRIDDTRYEVSLCDLIDSKLDILYHIQNRFTGAHNQTRTPSFTFSSPFLPLLLFLASAKMSCVCSSTNAKSWSGVLGRKKL